eukprot:5263409-Amphidinium_carterae.1
MVHECLGANEVPKGTASGEALVHEGKPVAIEICVGRASLTRAFHQAGWRAHPVDWKRCGHACVLPFLKVNVMEAYGQESNFALSCLMFRPAHLR